MYLKEIGKVPLLTADQEIDLARQMEAGAAADHLLLSEMDVAQQEEDCDALASFNRAFHGKIEHLSDKKRILRVIDDQEEYILRFSAVTIASIVRRSKAHQEHHQMVDLLERRDLAGLEKLMAHHLDESKQTCLAAVANRNKGE